MYLLSVWLYYNKGEHINKLVAIKTDRQKMKNRVTIFIEKHLTVIVLIFILWVLVSPILFTQFSIVSFSHDGSTGQIGDTIGGITAPAIGLLSAILLYLALTKQIENNNIIVQESNFRTTYIYTSKLLHLSSVGIKMKSLLIVCSIVFCSRFNLIKPHDKNADWTLVKNSNDIQIYTKDVPGSNLKELKINTKFQHTIDALLTLITDIPAQPSYIFGCTSAKRVGTPTEFDQSFYQTLYMPWPFKNRDAVCKQAVHPKSRHDDLAINTNFESGLVPISESFQRIESMHSSWRFLKIDENSISAEYKLRLNPGGSVPNWLVNMFLDKGPFNTILNMRKLLMQPKYANAYVAWLHPKTTNKATP